MFDYAYNNNYTIDEEKKQDTNEKNLFLENLHLLKETEEGYKLLCGVGSLQKNLRQFAIVYLQTPQGELYPQESVQMSRLNNRKGTLGFLKELPRFNELDEKEIEEIKEKIIEILKKTKEPVLMGADESPEGVYDEVVNRIHICSERIENNPKAFVFIKDNVGYIRTTFFGEFSKKLQVGYTRKEILGLLKMLGKLITDKGRAYDKRLHFGEVNGKYYAVRLPEGTVADRNENVKIVLPLLGKEESENMGADEKADDSKITFFGYYGGKNRMHGILNALMPQSKIYIEPFIGSGANLLNRGRSETEIVNDFEPAVSNLYKVLSDKEMGKELLEKMMRLPYDEKLFHTACEYQRENFKGINDIEKALLTFVLISQSYNNTRKQFSRGTYDTQSYQRKIHSNLPKVYERLQGVQVYNKNALDIIKEAADNPNVQMYLDPPYLHSLRGEGADKVYFKEMEYIDHVRMLETIKNAKCRILLSGYHADKDDLYDEYLLPYGWKSRELIKIVKSSQRKEERDIASEWIWFNYDIPDEGGME